LTERFSKLLQQGQYERKLNIEKSSPINFFVKFSTSELMNALQDLFYSELYKEENDEQVLSESERIPSLKSLCVDKVQWILMIRGQQVTDLVPIYQKSCMIGARSLMDLCAEIIVQMRFENCALFLDELALFHLSKAQKHYLMLMYLQLANIHLISCDPPRGFQCGQLLPLLEEAMRGHHWQLHSVLRKEILKMETVINVFLITIQDRRYENVRNLCWDFFTECNFVQLEALETWDAIPEYLKQKIISTRTLKETEQDDAEVEESSSQDQV